LVSSRHNFSLESGLLKRFHATSSIRESGLLKNYTYAALSSAGECNKNFSLESGLLKRLHAASSVRESCLLKKLYSESGLLKNSNYAALSSARRVQQNGHGWDL